MRHGLGVGGVYTGNVGMKDIRHPRVSLGDHLSSRLWSLRCDKRGGDGECASVNLALRSNQRSAARRPLYYKPAHFFFFPLLRYCSMSDICLSAMRGGRIVSALIYELSFSSSCEFQVSARMVSLAFLSPPGKNV